MEVAMDKFMEKYSFFYYVIAGDHRSDKCWF